MKLSNKFKSDIKSVFKMSFIILFVCSLLIATGGLVLMQVVKVFTTCNLFIFFCVGIIIMLIFSIFYSIYEQFIIFKKYAIEDEI